MDASLQSFINEKVWDMLPSPKTRFGTEYNFRCPICGDSKKSMHKKRGYFYTRTCSFFCFNCQTSMSGWKFLQTLTRDQDISALKAEYAQIMLKRGGRNPFNAFGGEEKKEPSVLDSVSGGKSVIPPSWKNLLSDKAREYLERRLVTEAPFLYDNAFYSCFDKQGREFILIPWIVNGCEAYYQINDFQKLDSAGRKYIFPPKLDKLIYNIDNVDLRYKKIILFEGVYDSLFVKNGVAIGGKFLTNTQKELLASRYPSHRLVYSFDNDGPGFEAAAKVMEKNECQNTEFFKWFNSGETAKDVNDYVLKTGNVNAFADKSFVDSHIINMMQMKMRLAERGMI